MTAPKRNEWLEIDASEEDDNDEHNLEPVEDSRSQRAAKRRKLNLEDESDWSSGLEDAAPRSDRRVDETEQRREYLEPTKSLIAGNVVGSILKSPPERSRPSNPSLKPKSKSSATGVIYISRVPPFMKPQTVKHLLEPYGELGRIFLTPEDPTSHSRRVKLGGNKKRSFTDGWVEFKRKADAKLAAETLNAQIIGGKKGGWYHDDLWNIKYLTGFKWHHLTEQIANENAERAARLRTEIAQTTKENKRFIENVERAKMLESIAAKKQRVTTGSRGLNNATDEVRANGVERGRGSPVKERYTERMHFRQSEVKSHQHNAGTPAEQSDVVRRTLSKIF